MNGEKDCLYEDNQYGDANDMMSRIHANNDIKLAISSRLDVLSLYLDGSPSTLLSPLLLLMVDIAIN